MKAKDRILAVLRHEEPDVVPFTVYTMLMPRGSGERELRNMGLGLVELGLSVYGIKTPNIKMQASQDLAPFLRQYRSTSVLRQKHTVQRTYNTPVGAVSDRYKMGYALSEWLVEWMIKDPEDYEVVEYMIGDTEYFSNHQDFLNAEAIMGDDGIVVAMTPKSPLQSMLLDLMGYRRFSLDYHTCRREFDQLYRSFFKKQLEMYEIVGDSPAQVVLLDDNINGVITSPELFEKYCMPFYEKVAEILHRKDKVFMVHCDGKLKCLRHLIAKTKIDVVEAFTPPPIGDLSIEEARTEWKGKVLWANFPATISLEVSVDRIESETLTILRSSAPGNDFALGITEDVGDIKSIRYQEILKAITKTVMRHGTYPIAK